MLGGWGIFDYGFDLSGIILILAGWLMARAGAADDSSAQRAPAWRG